MSIDKEKTLQRSNKSESEVENMTNEFLGGLAEELSLLGVDLSENQNNDYDQSEYR